MRPSPGTVLCALQAIADPGTRGFILGAFRAFVVRQGSKVRGFLDRCPHAGWPLAESDGGRMTREGDLLLCTGHGALFRPGDGMCIAGPCAGRALEPWPVRVQDGVVVTA